MNKKKLKQFIADFTNETKLHCSGTIYYGDYVLIFDEPSLNVIDLKLISDFIINRFKTPKRFSHLLPEIGIIQGELGVRFPDILFE